MYKVIVPAVLLCLAVGNIYATIQSQRLRADVATLHQQVDALTDDMARTQRHIIWENNNQASSLPDH